MVVIGSRATCGFEAYVYNNMPPVGHVWLYYIYVCLLGIVSVVFALSIATSFS